MGFFPLSHPNLSLTLILNRYYFRGKLHEVVVRDEDKLLMPLKAHLLKKKRKQHKTLEQQITELENAMDGGDALLLPTAPTPAPSTPTPTSTSLVSLKLSLGLSTLVLGSCLAVFLSVDLHKTRLAHLEGTQKVVSAYISLLGAVATDIRTEVLDLFK